MDLRLSGQLERHGKSGCDSPAVQVLTSNFLWEPHAGNEHLSGR